MTDSNLLTVSEFAQLCPEVNTAQYTPATISGMISTASKQVSDYLDYTPLAEDIVDELKQARITSEGDLLIFPEKLPIVSVSSIAIVKGATSIDVNIAQVNGNDRFNIDFNRRYISLPFSELAYQSSPIFLNFYNLHSRLFYAKMTYRAGYEPSALPGTIKQATALYMRDILARSMNTSGANKISQGGISLEFSSTEGKSDLIKDAERLLGPYRRIG